MHVVWSARAEAPHARLTVDVRGRCCVYCHRRWRVICDTTGSMNWMGGKFYHVYICIGTLPVPGTTVHQDTKIYRYGSPLQWNVQIPARTNGIPGIAMMLCLISVPFHFGYEYFSKKISRSISKYLIRSSHYYHNCRKKMTLKCLSLRKGNEIYGIWISSCNSIFHLC